MILAKLNRSEDVEAHDAVFVRLLTFMDHAADERGAGANEKVSDVIVDFLRNTAPPNPRPGLDHYQHGICLRKLKAWNDPGRP